jgi:hypothetical protein
MLSPAGMFENLADLALAHAACMSHRVARHSDCPL